MESWFCENPIIFFKSVWGNVKVAKTYRNVVKMKFPNNTPKVYIWQITLFYWNFDSQNFFLYLYKSRVCFKTCISAIASPMPFDFPSGHWLVLLHLAFLYDRMNYGMMLSSSVLSLGVYRQVCFHTITFVPVNQSF